MCKSVDENDQRLWPYCAQVKSEDLKVFDNVAYIDASINSLSLGEYSYTSCRFCASWQKVVTFRKCPLFFWRVFPQLCVSERDQSVVKRDLQHDVSCCWLPSSRGKMTDLLDTLVFLQFLILYIRIINVSQEYLTWLFRPDESLKAFYFHPKCFHLLLPLFFSASFTSAILS